MIRINKDFKDLWRRNSLNSENVLELVIVLFMWRYLSDMVLTNNPCRYKYENPGEKYHFDSLYTGSGSEYHVQFGIALRKWREVNPHLNDLFYLDQGNLNSNLVIDAWLLVKEITSGSLKDRWNNQHSELLLNEILSSFLTDWQFVHEYFTPMDVSTLIAGLVKRDDEITLYDPSCGSGGLLHTALISLPKVSKVTGVTKSLFMHKFCSIRLLLLDVPFSMFYSTVETQQQKFDVIITNPPFGIKEPLYKKNNGIDKWSNLPATNKSEIKYLTEVLNQLSDKGTAVVILPNGILSEKANYQIRREMIEENLLEAVIHLPKNIFFQTRVSASLLILNKQKTNKEVLFIDASDRGIKDRDRTRLTDNSVRLILDLYHNYEKNNKQLEHDKIICVELGTLREKKYDLQYISYNIPIKYKYPQPSNEILSECIVLEMEIADLQKKIKEIIS